MEFPKQFESSRLILRCYRHGDGDWYYAMSLKNRDHLRKYEAENVAANIANPEAAEILMGELANEWERGSCYFIWVFGKFSGDFAVQIYVGTVDGRMPE